MSIPGEYDLSRFTTAELWQQKQDIERNLHQIEEQISNLEKNYLEETANFGNVVKGFEGYLSARVRVSSNSRRTKSFKDSDRIFSLSSYSSVPTISNNNSMNNDNMDDMNNHLPIGDDYYAENDNMFESNRAVINGNNNRNKNKGANNSATGSVVYANELSNPLRKESAISDTNRQVVFSNARKRKLPASDEVIHKRRRRKIRSLPKSNSTEEQELAPELILEETNTSAPATGVVTSTETADNKELSANADDERASSATLSSANDASNDSSDEE